MSDDDRYPAYGLVTQTEARWAARVCEGVARPYPLGCWGGTDIGWTVEMPSGDLMFRPLPLTA